MKNAILVLLSSKKFGSNIFLGKTFCGSAPVKVKYRIVVKPVDQWICEFGDKFIFFFVRHFDC